MGLRTLLRRTFPGWSLVGRAGAAALPIVALTLYLFAESRKSDRLLLEAESARQADSSLLQLQALITTRVDALKGGAYLLTASTQEDAGPEFGRFVEHLFTEVPFFESVTRLDSSGRLLERFTPRPAASGGPPEAGGPLQTVVRKCLASHEAAATGCIDLPGGEEAVAVVVPAVRDNRVDFVLAGTIRLTPALRDLFGVDGPDMWNIQLSDRSGHLAYQSVASGRAYNHPVEIRHVPMADHAWRLRLWPTPALAATFRTGAPLRILVIGLVASLVVAVANLLLAQRERRLAEALRESERLAADRDATRRQLSELVNGIEAIIWESDAEQDRVTFVNAYARKLLGLEAERWSENPNSWSDHVHPDDRHIARENLLAATWPGQTYAAEYRMYDAQRRIIWVREIVTVIAGTAGRVRGRRGVVVDISARVEAEEALRQSQKLESLGVLTGGIAHDFNNLLTTILGNAEMLRPWLSGTESKGRTHLEKIERTTRRLAELTRQMLAYSGRGDFTVSEVNLNTILSELTDLLTVSTPKNIAVSFRLDPSLPAVRADAAQMRQVILNLVTNAAEAIGEHRHGEVIIRTGTTMLGSERIHEAFAGQDLEPGRYVSLEVSDTGSGMSAETLPKIFDPFFTTKFTGRGLGLAALRGILRSHRGGIRIFSRLGEGTVFTLVFPAVTAPGEQQSLDEPTPSLADGIAGHTILLVDDEENLRSLMAMALEGAGCRVIQAVDGEDGVEQFQHHSHLIDLTVLDLTMPRLNGDEVFRQIIRLEPRAKVILISGYTQEDVAEHFRGQRVAGYLEKPFPPSELLAKVRLVLQSALEPEVPATPLPPLPRPEQETPFLGSPGETPRDRPL